MKKLVQKIMLSGMLLGFAVQNVHAENSQLADQSVNIEDQYSYLFDALARVQSPSAEEKLKVYEAVKEILQSLDEIIFQLNKPKDQILEKLNSVFSNSSFLEKDITIDINFMGSSLDIIYLNHLILAVFCEIINDSSNDSKIKMDLNEEDYHYFVKKRTAITTQVNKLQEALTTLEEAGLKKSNELQVYLLKVERLLRGNVNIPHLLRLFFDL